MKSGTSLTLQEASRRLETSEIEVRRALQAGEFPGRFLVDGGYRIPLEEVERARERWIQRRPVVEAEIHSDPGTRRISSSLGADDVEELRRSMLAILREERRAVFQTLLVPLEKTEDRLARLEDEVRAVRRGVQALGSGSVEGEREEGGVWSSESEGPGGGVDVRGLVREIADLEAMLSDFEID